MFACLVLTILFPFRCLLRAPLPFPFLFLFLSKAGPVPGGLCRLRVRGTRSHEIMQRVLRTATRGLGEPAAVAVAGSVSPTQAPAAPPPAPAPAAGDDFETAAMVNATCWQSLRLQDVRSGVGGAGPRQLPSGSVLAITALDPREQRCRQQRRQAAPSTEAKPPAASGSAAACGSNTAAHSGKSTTQTGKSTGGSGTHPAGSVPKDPEISSPEAAAAASTAVREWPPRWAAVSPLWDLEARDLSAQLAAARPDHILNEARRRERRRQAWDHESYSATDSTTASTSASAAVPVILVSASGVPTTAHEESAPTATADSYCGLGGEGGGREKEAEKKRRAVAAGWDLIVPPGWAPVFFCALVMAGARAISLKEADGLALEAGESR